MNFKEAQGAAKRMRMLELNKTASLKIKNKKNNLKKKHEEPKPKPKRPSIKLEGRSESVIKLDFKKKKLPFSILLNLQKWLRNRYFFLKKIKFLQRRVRRFLYMKKNPKIYKKFRNFQIIFSKVKILFNKRRFLAHFLNYNFNEEKNLRKKEIKNYSSNFIFMSGG